jgi:hypothetical protein
MLSKDAHARGLQLAALHAHLLAAASVGPAASPQAVVTVAASQQGGRAAGQHKLDLMARCASFRFRRTSIPGA